MGAVGSVGFPDGRIARERNLKSAHHPPYMSSYVHASEAVREVVPHPNPHDSMSLDDFAADCGPFITLLNHPHEHDG